MSVREASILDVLPAMQLAESYFQEAGEYLGVPYDIELSVGRLAQAVQDPDQLLLVYSEGGEVVGALWAAYGPFLPWSTACISQDIVIYVRPSHRGRLGAYRLIQQFQAWSESKGAVECRLSIASGIHEEKTGAMYKRMGYQHLGSHYRRRI